MMPESYVAAVDGGGTSTDVALAEIDASGRTRVVARIAGGPSNLTTRGQSDTARLIEDLMRSLLRQSPGERLVRCALVSLAGAGEQAAREDLQKRLMDCGLAQRMLVMSDIEATLAIAECSAEADQAVIGLIAGTGSIAIGRLPDSESTIRAGGWGRLLGDEGSGFALGRAALQVTLAAIDADAELAPLSLQILKRSGATTASTLIRWAMDPADSVARISGLAPLVVGCGEQGDLVAQQILRQASDALRELLTCVARRLDRPLHEISITCSGSLIVKASAIRDPVERFAREQGFASMFFVEDPVLANLQLAAIEVAAG